MTRDGADDRSVALGRPLGPEACSLAIEGKAPMARLSLFNSPLLLGFDHFERTLDRLSKTPVEGYPPYNIEQIGANRLRITLAVAGFRNQDLSVRIEENQLVIRGRQEDVENRVYLHRGIAARQFQRAFVLAEGIEVEGADLDNGLLNVDLRRPEVEARSRTVEIRSATKSKSNGSSASTPSDATSPDGSVPIATPFISKGKP
jgi:HSP20 family molecular chaperone IbpA